MSYHSENEVLIVGAGPVGMLMALELLLLGIKPKIISKYERTSPHSKATIIWPRVLEILNRVGVAKDIIKNGHYFDQMNYYSNKRKIGDFRFDKLKYTNYNYGIAIPQWKTEYFLEEKLKSKGINIEYGSEFLDGYHCSDDSVATQIKNRNGQEVNCVFKYIIGADGFSSKVRECFGFNFDGFSMKTKLAITDAEIIGETTSREVGYYLHKTGNMVLAPIGDGIFRVGASIPENYKGEIDREFFNNVLKTRSPGNRKLGKINFCGYFEAHVRSADCYNKGNVFLVGDAAHAMSPSGAQGMNSGFQDVLNLSWKLAGVMNNKFDKNILNSYSEERKNGILRTSSLSTFLAKKSLYDNFIMILFRDLIFVFLSRLGFLDKFLSPRIAQIDIPMFDLKEGVNKIERGRRIPLEWEESCTIPNLSINSHTILMWPGDEYDYNSWNGLFNKLSVSFSEGIFINLAGNTLGLIRGLLPSKPLCIIVRPDGFISKVLDVNDELNSNLNNEFNFI
ncbi:FAD-dependent monooxygenase [Vibrio gazogenes]|uniref:2-polyprenyl-6-methoxyphenol hydroxylase n=1 Tax=Vibrio gazogenes DSM 21264 = NBRC 103151 TaxID=1123492 RepID=A0A1M5CKB9_VIBGA|nr:FAD-dependent monooxygenase [Vibrio gazogenes]USP14223.1 FAD-dependent monooxygenase [Vibrio gazogenes]SHF55158.1 2-polyprenyl-6-methoxyphenol hydroxylase [Vibrio gazogenes DSM 21264] [Vibrio gazogenes DSM 21264 = NBRC 103151]SJN53727.1 Pentachlorophenol 4-monooxygenase [Vibrio gazogenes]